MKFISLFFLGAVLGAPPAYAGSVCVKDVCVHVEVVSKTEDMQRGLQGRDGLLDHEGMLFIFNTDDLQKFWMKDMKFAIDMIWMDRQGTIVTIVPSCPPCVQEPCKIYAPSKQARYVLEVPSGFALNYQLKQGDIFRFRGIN